MTSKKTTLDRARRTSRAVNQAQARRDAAILDALAANNAAAAIARTTGLSRARIYQIKNGHNSATTH